MPENDPLEHLKKLDGVEFPKGNYRLLSLIASTNMSVVYRAYDNSSKQSVAIKILADDRYLQRFTNEATMSYGLLYPNIATTIRYDLAGEVLSNGTSARYIVMKYLSGPSLGGILKNNGQPGVPGPGTLDTALLITHRIAPALQHVHDRGIVHRDIKPSNILYDNGDPYLIDFGIAKHVNSPQAGVLADVTQVNETPGTSNYMPPEQWFGDVRSGATDQYALAFTIYEVLSNRVSPLQYVVDTGASTGGLSTTSTRMRVVWQNAHIKNTPIPITQYNPAIPPAAWEVLSRAMAKDEHQRWESIAEFGRAFEEAVMGRPAVVIAPAPPPQYPAAVIPSVPLSTSAPKPIPTPVFDPERTAVEDMPSREDVLRAAAAQLQPTPVQPPAAPTPGARSETLVEMPPIPQAQPPASTPAAAPVAATAPAVTTGDSIFAETPRVASAAAAPARRRSPLLILGGVGALLLIGAAILLLSQSRDAGVTDQTLTPIASIQAASGGDTATPGETAIAGAATEVGQTDQAPTEIPLLDATAFVPVGIEEATEAVLLDATISAQVVTLIAVTDEATEIPLLEATAFVPLGIEEATEAVLLDATISAQVVTLIAVTDEVAEIPLLDATAFVPLGIEEATEAVLLDATISAQVVTLIAVTDEADILSVATIEIAIDTPVPTSALPTTAPTATDTRTPTDTPTRAATEVSVAVVVSATTAVPTNTDESTATDAPTATRTLTTSPTDTLQPTNTRIILATTTAVPTTAVPATPAPTNTDEPTATDAPTATATHTLTASPTATLQPTNTRIVLATTTAAPATPVPTSTDEATATNAPTVLSNTATRTPGPYPTKTPFGAAASDVTVQAQTQAPTNTSEAIVIPTTTPAPLNTDIPASPTQSPSQVPTEISPTKTPLPLPTATQTNTAPPSATLRPTSTDTPLPTNTPFPTATRTPTQTVAASLTPTSAPISSEIVVVAGDNTVSMLTAPNGQYVRDLPLDVILNVRDASTDRQWVDVVLPDGRSGWIPSAAVNLVRDQPNSQGAVLARIPSGSRVEIITTSSDGAWYNVRLNDNTEGWMASQLLRVTTPTPVPSATPTLDPNAPTYIAPRRPSVNWPSGTALRITTGAQQVWVRAAPSSRSNAIVITLANNNPVTATGNFQYDNTSRQFWFEVRTQTGLVGWVEQGSLTP